MIYLIEGPRNSGKTFLIDSLKFDSSRQSTFYKFPFAQLHEEMWAGLIHVQPDGEEIHNIAFGKELMLHSLNNENILPETPILVDRGIITTMVWGLLEGRVSEIAIDRQVAAWNNMNLMDHVALIIVHGDNPDTRGRKDQWDDKRSKEEWKLFQKIIPKFKSMNNFSVNFVENNFDPKSLKLFRSLITELDTKYVRNTNN